MAGPVLWNLLALPRPRGGRASRGIAAVLAARGILLLGVGFALMNGLATGSVIHTGLRELEGQYLRPTVRFAQQLSADVAARHGPADSVEVRRQLALLSARQPDVGFFAVTWRDCARACDVVVSEPAFAASAAHWVHRHRSSEGLVGRETVSLAGETYLAIAAALRDPEGKPLGRLTMAVDAGRVTDQARTTAWLLAGLAYAMLLVAGWWSRRMLEASVADRIRLLIDTLERPGAPLSAHAMPVRDELGELAENLEAHMERSLERLRESEERYRRLVEFSPDAILVHADGRVLYVNGAGVRLCGARSAAELNGAAVEQVVRLGAPSGTATPPPLPGETPGAPPVREGRLHRADGSVVDVEVSEIPLTYEGGHAVQAVIRDVSDRKRAEEALRHSEATYRALVEHASYGMFRSDDGRRFRAVNPALVQMLGYDSADELLHRDLAQHVYLEPDQRSALVARFRETRGIHTVEADWRKRDGTPIVVRLTGQAIRDAAGSFVAFEMMVEDVTERRVLEAQLRQAQKMEAVGRLTGGVAHDFNNLLTVIAANAELVRTALPPDAANARAELDELQAASRRGAALVRKLLAFSRAEKLERRPVRVGALLGEVSYMLRRILPEHIEVRLPTAPEAATVLADTGAIEQVLLNLATNARDAMPDGGVLEIASGSRMVDAAYCTAQGWGAPGCYVVLTVRDSGLGMDDITRARMFEPFFTTKAPESGTGLGMSIVYGLMRLHFGFVEVESAVGRGTMVTLLLPAVAEAAPDGPAECATPLGCGGGELILLVEDEESIRRATRKILERHGYRVLLAANGEEALELIRGGADAHPHAIDLVISDMMMPKLGGAGLFEALRAEGWLRPFLFISGYSTDIAELGDLGGTAVFLHKPWELRQLVEKVRETLDAAVSRS